MLKPVSYKLLSSNYLLSNDKLKDEFTAKIDSELGIFAAVTNILDAHRNRVARLMSKCVVRMASVVIPFALSCFPVDFD